MAFVMKIGRFQLLVILPILFCSNSPVIASSVRNQEPELIDDPRFGAVEAFWDPTAAMEAGVSWERILFYWSQLQPTDRNDWNTLHVPDEWLQWASSQGREVVGVVKNTPAWATDADIAWEASPPRGLYLDPSDPENIWAAFLHRLVTHYAPRGVHHWVIWNEPDIPLGVYGQEWTGSVEEYYRLLKVAYTVIKEADPIATVHLAGITYWHDRTWLNEFLAIAQADPGAASEGYFFDVVSLHIYFQTDTVDWIINETRATLAEHNLIKPIWINETNASPDQDPLWPLERPRWRVDLTEQASFILQAFALGLAAGAERIAVYKFIDTNLPPGGEPFGLLRPDHSRRPAYKAFQLVTSYYANTFSARIVREPLWTQVLLQQPDRTVRVFWARTKTPVTVLSPAFAQEAFLVGQEGSMVKIDPIDAVYQINLPGARCADEILGCIVGGPTFLLVEKGVSDNGSTLPEQQAESGAIATATTTPTPGLSSEIVANFTPTGVDSHAIVDTVMPTPPIIVVPTRSGSTPKPLVVSPERTVVSRGSMTSTRVVESTNAPVIIAAATLTRPILTESPMVTSFRAMNPSPAPTRIIQWDESNTIGIAWLVLVFLALIVIAVGKVAHCRKKRL